MKAITLVVSLYIWTLQVIPTFTELAYQQQVQGTYRIPVGNQIYSSQNQIHGSQVDTDYGNIIPESTDIRKHLVPVAIISSTATPVNYPPLTISVKRNALLRSVNEGDRIASYPQGQEDVAILRGGPTPNGSEYRFSLLTPIYVDYPNTTRAGGTEDGCGFPIQLELVFYKKVYGSPKNALNYTDGFIVITFRVIVEGMIPNPLFEPYYNLLTQISRFNSTAEISAYNAFEWLLSVLDSYYYVFPSSIIDPTTGIRKPCATNIAGKFSKHAWISYCQFTAFENILNKNNQPETNSFPLFPLAGRFFGQANSPIRYSYDCE